MKDEIEKAFDTLIGYCQKRTFCEDGCRFYVESSCLFQKQLPPVDWQRERRTQNGNNEN